MSSIASDTREFALSQAPSAATQQVAPVMHLEQSGGARLWAVSGSRIDCGGNWQYGETCV